MSAAPITAGAASPCIASRRSTTACGRSAPQAGGHVAGDGCSAGAAGTGSRPMPRPCSARRPRAWPRRRAAMSRRATARSSSAGASSARIPAATASWSPPRAKRWGPTAHLLVDPGWYPAGWTEPGPMRSRREAVELCQWLADYDVGWVEDFIHPGEFRRIRLCARAQPGAGRGRRAGRDDLGFRALHRRRLRRRHPAGPLALRRRQRRASRWPGWPTEAGIDLVPHSWLTHLLTGYSLQLIATLPRARFVEFNVSQSALTRGITQAPFAIGRGRHRRHPRHARHRRRGRSRLHRGPPGQLSPREDRDARRRRYRLRNAIDRRC